MQLDFAMVALGFQKAPNVGPPDGRSPRGRPASKGSQSAIDTIIGDGTVNVPVLNKIDLWCAMTYPLLGCSSEIIMHAADIKSDQCRLVFCIMKMLFCIMKMFCKYENAVQMSEIISFLVHDIDRRSDSGNTSRVHLTHDWSNRRSRSDAGRRQGNRMPYERFLYLQKRNQRLD